jgi:hypothetical protein
MVAAFVPRLFGVAAAAASNESSIADYNNIIIIRWPTPSIDIVIVITIGFIHVVRRNGQVAQDQETNTND